MGGADAHADVPFLKKIAFSAIGGAVATTVIFPIDLTKTILQHQSKASAGAAPPAAGTAAPFRGPLDVVVRTLRERGPTGLYRGWPPAVILVMPEKAIKLTMNEQFRKWLSPRGDGADLTLLRQMLAGGLAGMCQVTVTCPMELLKIQGGTRTDLIPPGGTKPAYGRLAKSLGPAGLYTGVLATLLRDVPFSFMYFPAYAISLERLEAFPLLEGHRSVAAFGAGAIAGTFAAAATTPLDVIKTRVHSGARPSAGLGAGEYLRREIGLVTSTASSILAKEGPAAFFKGVIPRCAIVSPLFAITMQTFEFLKTVF
jgi:hypothetical protein